MFVGAWGVKISVSALHKTFLDIKKRRKSNEHNIFADSDKHSYFMKMKYYLQIADVYIKNEISGESLKGTED